MSSGFRLKRFDASSMIRTSTGAKLCSFRDLLEKRARQARTMIKAVDAALAVLDDKSKGATMNMKEMFEGFDPAKYEEEAQERWVTPRPIRNPRNGQSVTPRRTGKPSRLNRTRSMKTQPQR